MKVWLLSSIAVFQLIRANEPATLMPATTIRRLMQTRRIVCEGYERSDGLYDIEATMIDVKPYAVSVGDRDAIPADEPFHHMRLRIAIDSDLIIHEAEAETIHAPYHACPEICKSYGQLVGLQLGPGFKRQVRARLGGPQGCTHLTELLVPMVTAAMQTVWHVRDQLERPRSERTHWTEGSERPAEIDGCHALRADGEVVKLHYPMFKQG
jgi:hypothetical protein